MAHHRKLAIYERCAYFYFNVAILYNQMTNNNVIRIRYIYLIVNIKHTSTV